MVAPFVDAIFDEVFNGLTKCTDAPAIGAFTDQPAVAPITTIVNRYFGCTLSFTAVAITMIITIGIGFDNGFLLNGLRCPRGRARIITISGGYFNCFNDIDVASL